MTPQRGASRPPHVIVLTTILNTALIPNRPKPIDRRPAAVYLASQA